MKVNHSQPNPYSQSCFCPRLSLLKTLKPFDHEVFFHMWFQLENLIKAKGPTATCENDPERFLLFGNVSNKKPEKPRWITLLNLPRLVPRPPSAPRSRPARGLGLKHQELLCKKRLMACLVRLETWRPPLNTNFYQFSQEYSQKMLGRTNFSWSSWRFSTWTVVWSLGQCRCPTVAGVGPEWPWKHRGSWVNPWQLTQAERIWFGNQTCLIGKHRIIILQDYLQMVDFWGTILSIWVSTTNPGYQDIIWC